MTALLLWDDNNSDTHIDQVTEAQVVEAIYALDGKKKLGGMLHSIYGHLFIDSCAEGRLRVRYSRIGEFACLIDKHQVGSQMLEFPLDNGTVDDVPIRATVSRDTAIEVALYFSRNNFFPKGLDWDGNTRYLPIEGMLPFRW